uniref:Methyltransferase type 11 domain-containing protein n=1 Tax=Chromera velia CCMP2878 TaxID=1169474 RepID=A0A0G4FHC5_9ALVE|eukprot:Cvel_17013.t1-p1 / transcript=Cvel_17013.t1 / gene=Cvel_17013 / organism=Chromera_velia_CCMP2878 / gene_product=Probable tocopherol O-methyltransferase,, putative / transcript_product=Probable tocopherol O-methyltransferase,, putative / location=Cvel_scaffold1337:42267-47662(+) / protein_length=449 / sequence_SO=supercontig / SO=protein_coding / is_pseudo=false
MVSGRRVSLLFVFLSAIPACSRVLREDAELKKGIAHFYDKSSAIWEDIWGEHMHHGWYPNGTWRSDHQQAQVDMIDRVLLFADPEGKFSARTAVDVGCGVGGSSRHIARRYGGSKVKGITLSPYQCMRARVRTEEAGLSDRVEFRVADAMQMPFQSDSFDLVWSLESGEHMPEKANFVRELTRVCRPGGKVVVVTWCHRVLNEAAGEKELRADEKKLLGAICDAYYLPQWCSIEDYRKLAEKAGLQNVRTDDWTESIRHFWPAVIKTAISPRGLFGLLASGKTTLRGAAAMFLMERGYRKGLIRFAAMTADKPGSRSFSSSPSGGPKEVLSVPLTTALARSFRWLAQKGREGGSIGCASACVNKTKAEKKRCCGNKAKRQASFLGRTGCPSSSLPERFRSPSRPISSLRAKGFVDREEKEILRRRKKALWGGNWTQLRSRGQGGWQRKR